MEDMGLICLQVTSNTGEARSGSMAALAAARDSRSSEAGEYLAATGGKMKETHYVHTRLITMDTSEKSDKTEFIMIHSEDIMMGAEAILALAREMVETYKSRVQNGEGV